MQLYHLPQGLTPVDPKQTAENDWPKHGPHLLFSWGHIGLGVRLTELKCVLDLAQISIIIGPSVPV